MTLSHYNTITVHNRQQALCSVVCCCWALSVYLCPAQEKAEGEPKVKKGKTLLDDDDGEENDEEVDESPEEVLEIFFLSPLWRKRNEYVVIFLMFHVNRSCFFYILRKGAVEQCQISSASPWL